MITGFTVKNWLNLKPNEDSFLYSEDEKIIAVADGITRDPRNMPILPGSKLNLWAWYKFFKNYPNPSPAESAADLFCDIAVETMIISEEKNEKAMSHCFELANRAMRMKNLRDNPNPDYLENDYHACVAAIATLERDILSWGYIADCGICVYNKDGDMTNETKNEGPSKKLKDFLKENGISFRKPDGRRFVRRDCRNNIANKLAYGALTGESVAMHYVRTGQWVIEPGDSIVVHSDGLEHVLKDGKFIDKIRQRDIEGIRKVCQKNVKTEGTAVIYFNEKK
jgi:hypothetical protein